MPSHPPSVPLARRTTALVLLALGPACGGDGTVPSPAAHGGAGASSAGSGGASLGGGATAGASSGGAATAGSATGGASPMPSTAGTGGTGGFDGGSGGAAPGGGGSTAGATGQAGAGGEAGKYVPISFGTQLDPAAQTLESKQLAVSLANPSAPSWRAKGDQRRSYRFAGVNEDIPFRVCVPTNWDGASKLPLVMFLHGAGNDESSYLDQNGKQMVKLADQHGFVLVSPLGYGGAYGTILRLPADFGRPDEAAKMIAARTEQIEKTQQLSEKDVINVLEIVLNEYPIERAQMFLTGHSMGSGGTWYIGAKYSAYWAALAPMSGPFVLELGYPWENLRDKPVFVTEGLSAATVAGSHAVRDWMKAQGFPVTYKEVNADHAGMVPLVLPDVFTFFDESK